VKVRSSSPEIKYEYELVREDYLVSTGNIFSKFSLPKGILVTGAKQ
jgi:hypothetical protein